MCFWSEAHFVKDGLCELVDVTICDVPEVRDQSWAATVKSIKNAKKSETDDPPSRKHIIVGCPDAIKFSHISQQA